jgi:hypothetical protein
MPNNGHRPSPYSSPNQYAAFKQRMNLAVKWRHLLDVSGCSSKWPVCRYQGWYPLHGHAFGGIGGNENQGE